MGLNWLSDMTSSMLIPLDWYLEMIDVVHFNIVSLTSRARCISRFVYPSEFDATVGNNLVVSIASVINSISDPA